MKVTEELLDVDEFDRRTNNRWRGEPLEVFACPSCGLIVLGIPDCHTALHDPHDLKTNMSYNMARKIRCPKCKEIWYDYAKKDAVYRTREVTDDELSESEWRWILKARV